MYDRDEVWTNDNQPTGNNWGQIELKRQHEQRMAQQQAINSRAAQTGHSTHQPVREGKWSRRFRLLVGILSAIGIAIPAYEASAHLGVTAMSALLGFFVGAGAPWLVLSGVAIYLFYKN